MFKKKLCIIKDNIQLKHLVFNDLVNSLQFIFRIIFKIITILFYQQ